jgi:hypothetical protein
VQIVELIAILLLLALAVLASMFVRRWLLVRAGGSIELYLRVSTLVMGRGWAPGFGRFIGEQLRWYRMFSLAPRPRRVLSRRGLAVESRRAPAGSERLSLPVDWVILRCTSHHAPVEIAMASSAVNGFLSWIEAAPPGAVSIYSYHPTKD